MTVLSFALFSVFSVRASPDLPGIIGTDDRHPLSTDKWPWSAIGRVNQNQGSAHCTGTLIAPNKVLTAGHCIYDAKHAKWFLPKEIAFIPDFRPNYDYAFSRGASFTFDLKDVPANVDLEFISHDWAIITLEKSLPQKPIPIRPIQADWVSTTHKMQLTSAGYSADRPYLLSVDYDCNLKTKAANDAVLVTDCDSTKGNSGAPVLLRHGHDEWYVVGVFSSAAQQGSPEMATFAVSAKVFSDKY